MRITKLMLMIQVCSLASFVASALAQTPYYAGKTITIVRGGGTGGSGEFQSRELVPFLKKYIPGTPTITMEFMDGASGRKGANLYDETRRTEDRFGGGDDSRADSGIAGEQLRHRQVHLHRLDGNG